MSKIKIRAVMWDVYADNGAKFPPYLGMIARDPEADGFTAHSSAGGMATFKTRAKAVEYIIAKAAA